MLGSCPARPWVLGTKTWVFSDLPLACLNAGLCTMSMIVVLCATSSSALLAQRPPEEALKAKLRQDIISSLSEVQRPVAQPPALSTLDRVLVPLAGIATARSLLQRRNEAGSPAEITDKPPAYANSASGESVAAGRRPVLQQLLLAGGAGVAVGRLASPPAAPPLVAQGIEASEKEGEQRLRQMAARIASLEEEKARLQGQAQRSGAATPSLPLGMLAAGEGLLIALLTSSLLKATDRRARETPESPDPITSTHRPTLARQPAHRLMRPRPSRRRAPRRPRLVGQRPAGPRIGQRHHRGHRRPPRARRVARPLATAGLRLRCGARRLAGLARAGSRPRPRRRHLRLLRHSGRQPAAEEAASDPRRCARRPSPG